MKLLALSTRLAALALALAPMTSAQAHEGHGLPGIAHWHSTDTLGFVALGVLVAAVIWFRSGK